MSRHTAAGLWICAGLILGTGALHAESASEEAIDEAAAMAESEAGESQAREDVVIFDRMEIVGSASEAFEIPGSAHYIGAAELEEQSYGDIHRILRAIPGVNVQEEEGYGLRPNIGMRGTGVERSQKVTLLEDGVLIAPAPYSAPAAYYFPTAGRMEGIEVRKGSASVAQGPYTNGGVLNMLSTAIPGNLGVRLEAEVGEDALGRFHGLVGDSGERIGWLMEAFHLETDGFKDLDGGGPTGVDLDDYLGKLRFNTAEGARAFQAVELKVGLTDQLGDETYVGLSQADFERTPYRRYAGSRRDTITAEHEQFQVRHLLRPNDRFDLTTTVYRNDFFRNWYKLQTVAGVSLGPLLETPESFPDAFAILRGELDEASGALRIRANRREYYSEGLESRATLSLGRDLSHELQLGVRWHRDQEDRFQEEDDFAIVGGVMSLVRAGAPGSQANRVSDAEALAFFVQDRMRFGRFTVTPGVRIESIDFTRRDFARDDPKRVGGPSRLRENGVDVVIPGVGATFELSQRWALFAGVHRGFAPPGPGQDERVNPEESVNTEIGVRHSGAVRFSATGFVSDYDNLLGTDTLSSGGGGTGDQFNGGEVTVRGVELSFDTDLARERKISMPLRLAYTFTEAEFDSSFTTSFPDWAPEVRRGDALPFIPRQQWSLALGAVGERWGAHAALSYAGEMRTRAGRGPIPASTGTEDALIVDLSADLRLPADLSLFAQVRNLTDEVHVVARRPAGARPNLPRTAVIGLRWALH